MLPLSSIIQSTMLESEKRAISVRPEPLVSPFHRSTSFPSRPRMYHSHYVCRNIPNRLGNIYLIHINRIQEALFSCVTRLVPNVTLG